MHTDLRSTEGKRSTEVNVLNTSPPREVENQTCHHYISAKVVYLTSQLNSLIVPMNNQDLCPQFFEVYLLNTTAQHCQCDTEYTT